MHDVYLVWGVYTICGWMRMWRKNVEHVQLVCDGKRSAFTKDVGITSVHDSII